MSPEEKQRQEDLKELSRAVAARPFSLDRALAACASVEKVYSAETRIEAVAVAAAFEFHTKGVDITGKPALEGIMLKVMRVMMYVISF
ncbi:MAG: hypothetical protein SGARI_007645, partial [Bacillariaceae sp.]